MAAKPQHYLKVAFGEYLFEARGTSAFVIKQFNSWRELVLVEPEDLASIQPITDSKH